MIEKTFIRKDITLLPGNKELRFLELIEGWEIKKDEEKYPGYTFYFKDDKCLFEFFNSILLANYHHIWIIFEKDYDMEYSEIKSFIKVMVEKHFKLKGVTPVLLFTRTMKPVEKHFKLKGIIPLDLCLKIKK